MSQINISANVINLSNLEELVKSEGILLPDTKTVGYGLSLRKGDKITLKEGILSCVSSKELLSEGEWAKDIFFAWVADVVTETGMVLRDQIIPVKTVCRKAQSYPSLDEYVVEPDGSTNKKKPNLSGLDFFEAAMRSLKLADDSAIFNRDISKGESQIDKVKRLVGKSLVVIGEAAGYTRRFNKKGVENWGSEPQHWSKTKVLFFAEAEASEKGE